MTMYIAEAREILRTIKFLDFKFDLMANTRSQGYLTVEYKAPDTRNRDSNINLNFMKVVSLESLGAKDFLLLVYDSVLDVLKHEASELFVVNGVDVFNEHDDNKNHKMRTIESMFKIKTPFGSHMSYQPMMDAVENRDYWNQRAKLHDLEYKYLRD